MLQIRNNKENGTFITKTFKYSTRIQWEQEPLGIIKTTSFCLTGRRYLFCKTPFPCVIGSFRS